jgi:hypothetical protein
MNPFRSYVHKSVEQSIVGILATHQAMERRPPTLSTIKGALFFDFTHSQYMSGAVRLAMSCT